MPDAAEAGADDADREPATISVVAAHDAGTKGKA